MSEDTQNGNIELHDEHRLSEDALRIDIMIIKKKPGVTINRVWGKIMREHNIVEYKSPVSPALSILVFNKVVHGYAGIYASQNKADFADMTVTLVCVRKPVKLFKALKEDFGYNILRDGDGIYYRRFRHYGGKNQIWHPYWMRFLWLILSVLTPLIGRLYC